MTPAPRRPPEWPASNSRYRVTFGFTVALLVLAPLGIGAYYLLIGSSAGARYALAFAVLGTLVSWLDFETRDQRQRNGYGLLALFFASMPLQITRLWRQDRLPDVPRQDRQGTVPMIDIPGGFLAVDPLLVYHLAGFYLENRQARAVLGTEQAVHRARTQAFG
ncbi:hypothetical protein SAMN05216266_101807 [Amycolatopsis marina]|uniref:Uncharacterized protein n=1 Tax=Amycolatopsis marina TaxID=490629 RepID=A0A1I0W7M9_9PSEU|nr:hypothetical protein [Amycolatopsis marina]SFA84564.1 hypothetical protein SAMN05216266_101807 [Amycolatopsis marina]